MSSSIPLADRVSLVLWRVPDQVSVLSIEDDGRGFDTTRLPPIWAPNVAWACLECGSAWI